MYHYLKRALDVFFSALLLLLLWPALAVLMAAVRADSKGPAIFRQVRAGRGRRLFTIYKLRTMAEGAERFAGLLAPQGTALKDRAADPRITRIGRFLRKYSLDELPQLINVFLGQMNLIGPRPGLPREVALYSEHDMKRLAVKPGCSGPWQVMGRSHLGFNEMVELDLHYIENRSLRQDLRLIFGTLKTMFSGEGAM